MNPFKRLLNKFFPKWRPIHSDEVHLLKKGEEVRVMRHGPYHGYWIATINISPRRWHGRTEISIKYDSLTYERIYGPEILERIMVKEKE